MNESIKKSYAFITVLVMILGLMATPVYSIRAQESGDVEEVSGTYTWYNERLFDSYEEATAAVADITAENRAEDIADNYLNDAGEVVYVPTFKDTAAAADFVRKCMVERRVEIECIYDLSGKYNTYAEGEALADEIMGQIYNLAIDDTPNSDEGDYLNWNVSAFKGKYLLDEKTGKVGYIITPTYFTTFEQEKVVTNKVNELLNTEFEGWENRTDTSNAYKVYCWLIDNFHMAESLNDYTITAYAGIDGGKTADTGYSSMAYRLLKEMGISSRIVGTSDLYTWNIVEIGDVYFEFDAFFGDTIYSSTANATKARSYFLVSNSYMNETDIDYVNKAMHSKDDAFISSEFMNRYPLARMDYFVFNPSEEHKIVVTNPTVNVSYRTHVQREGWQAWKSNGTMSGTSGKALRLEGIEIKLSGDTGIDLGIEYKTHIQSYGWESDWKQEGKMSGTSGEAKRLEAIKIRLTGADAALYDVYYRVHAQSYGWLGWAKNGEEAGTAGQGKRLEGIEIMVVKKDTVPSGIIGYSYVEYGKTADQNSEVTGMVNYRTHVQSYGWQGYVYDGSLSGTFGEAKRLESINISLGNTGYTGGITYRTHIQSIGWQEWKTDGAMSGTSGQAKRLEAIEIKLTGEVAKYYDVYYRVHAQSYGWLDWAKNGQSAGTAGYGKRLESIQIVLLPKGSAAPGATARPYVSR